jgi:hypothetical protein
VPAVAVLSGNTLYGVLVALVVLGFVSPDKDASAFAPQVADDRITRSAFVAVDPSVVQESCRSQLTVSVQALSWASGPCKVNIPTVKLNFCGKLCGS